MKKIEIELIEAESFKGLGSVKIEFRKGKPKIICGGNGVGKTTIDDIVKWVLSDEDSTGNPGVGKKAFTISPLDEDGNIKPNLKTIGRVVLNVDGESFNILKTFRFRKSQKITEKKPETVIEYEIDDVPKTTKTAYNKKLKDILGVDSEEFKILSNIDYFNNQMDFKSKREILINLVGKKSEAELIEAYPKREKILGIVGKHSIEDAKVVQKLERKRLNDRLNDITTLIEERKRDIIEDIGDASEVEAKIDMFRKEESKIKTDIENIDTKRKEKDTLYTSLQNKKTELEDSIKEDKNSDEKPLNNAKKVYSESTTKLSDKKTEIDNTKRTKLNLEADLEKICKDNIDNESGKVSLKEKYKARKGEKFSYPLFEYPEFIFEEKEDVCECCGGNPFKDSAATRKANAQAEYDKKKQDAINNYNTEGKKAQDKWVESINNSLTAMEQENGDLKAKGEKLEEQHSLKKDEIQKCDDKIEALTKELPDVEKEIEANKKKVDSITINGAESEKTTSLKTEVETDEKEYNDFIIADSTELNTKLSSIDEDIKELEKSIKSKVDNEKTLARIKELEDEQKEKGKLSAIADQNISALDDFIKYKFTGIQDDINSKFEFVSFKLFEEQKSNDLIVEICETLIDGVPYSTNANTAKKINAGVDVINVLNDYYGVSCPVTIDGAESINDVLNTDNQLMLIEVTEGELVDFNSFEEFNEHKYFIEMAKKLGFNSVDEYKKSLEK